MRSSSLLFAPSQSVKRSRANHFVAFSYSEKTVLTFRKNAEKRLIPQPESSTAVSALPPDNSPPRYAATTAYGYQPVEDKNGLAIAALVLGIVALVLGAIPGIGVLLGWLPGLLAIIFGLVSGIPNRPRRVLGIVGASLAVLAALVAIMWVAIFSAIGANETDTNSSSSNLYSDSSTEPEADSFTPPAGFQKATDEVYFKWDDSDSSNGLWREETGTLIAPDGCSSLWIYANLVDSDDAIVGSTSDFVADVPAGQKVKVKFSIFDDDAKSIKLSDVNCY